MLLVEPNPFYLLLEEAEITSRAATAILSFLSIHLKVDKVVICWYAYAAIFKDAKDFFSHQNLVIVNQWEIVQLSHRVICVLLQKTEYGVIKGDYISIK